MESNLLEGHTKGVRTLSWSPDSKLLASASFDNTIRIWNTKGEAQQVLRGHHSEVHLLAWSPDSQVLAALEPGGGSSGELTAIIGFWRSNGELIKMVKSPPVRAMAWSPDGKFLATGAMNNMIGLWNQNGDLVKGLKGHQGPVYSLAWSPISGLLVSSATGGEILFWDKNWEYRKVIHDSDRGKATKLEWAPDGKLLASYDGGRIKIWSETADYVKDLVEGIATSTAHNDDIIDVVWESEGQYLISASWDRTIQIWSRAGECLKYIRVPEVRSDTHFFLIPRNISWSQKGNIFASTFNDGTLRFWNLEGECIGTSKLYVFRDKNQYMFINPLVMALDMGDYDDKVLWSPNGGNLAIWERTSNAIILFKWIFSRVEDLTITTRDDLRQGDEQIKTKKQGKMTCPICHKRFKPEDAVYRCHYCKTIYHSLCILQWIVNENHPMCPQCNNLFISG